MGISCIYEKILHSLNKKSSHFSREITNENRQFKPEMYVVQNYRKGIFFWFFNFKIGTPIFYFSSTCCKLKDLELCYSQENFYFKSCSFNWFFSAFSILFSWSFRLLVQICWTNHGQSFKRYCCKSGIAIFAWNVPWMFAYSPCKGSVREK